MPEDESDPDDTTSTPADRRPDSGDDDEDPSDEAAEMPAGGTEGVGVVNRVMDVWEEVIADMEATAEAYREEGWRVLAIHPGDVASPDGEQTGRWGLDVLVPDDEFEELEHLIEVESFSFDESEVYRATGSGLVYLVVAILDHDTEVAVVFPAYYDVDRGRSMLDRATDAGVIHTHLRPLDLENVVTFSHDDPSLFMPPTSGESSDSGRGDDSDT